MEGEGNQEINKYDGYINDSNVVMTHIILMTSLLF